MKVIKMPQKKQTENQKETTQEAVIETSLGSDAPPDGFADLNIPQLDGGEVDPYAPITGEAAELDANVTLEVISLDAFYQMFEFAFALPQTIAPDFKPVAIQPSEKDAARNASDALYGLLEKYYPAALSPANETLQQLATVGMFTFGKAMLVKAIIEARRNPPPQKAHQQAGDAPPDGNADENLAWMEQAGNA